MKNNKENKETVIRVVLNQTLRTATIRVYYDEKTRWKYRTFPFDKKEWETVKTWKSEDWKKYLTIGEYREIK